MAHSDSRPNILFIMSDDHACKAIGAYGSRLASVLETPHLDSLAQEGCRLTNCACTNAICTPSRSVILTGKSSHITGVRTLSDSLSPDENTYPEMMQSAGYETAIFGKWHVHCEPQGFDDYEILPGQGEYFDPEFVKKSLNPHWQSSKSGGNNEYPEGKREEGYVTDIITDKCINWLDQRNHSKPFMLMCHHKAPHDDFEYHQRYEHLFDDIEMPEPGNLWEDKSHRSDGSRDYGTTVSERNMRRNAVKTMSQPDYPTGQLNLKGLGRDGRTKAAYQKYLKDYCRVVKGIDDNVGRLLGHLENLGLRDNTIVIYTSDQGMFLGEHDYIDKRWIYEEALQMPFLVRWPEEIPDALSMDSVVSNLDIAPTLLDFARIDIPEDMQGRSFRSILKGDEPGNWENIMYHRYWMHMAHHDVPAHFGIRTKCYKLILFYGMPLDATDALPDITPVGWELYDLVEDPNENCNVFDDPAYTSIRRKLMIQLFEERKRLGEDDSPYPELSSILAEAYRIYVDLE